MNLNDLKNLDLKNLSVEDLKQKVLAFADKKTLIKVGISLGSIIVFLIIYYEILNPIVEKKRNQINDMKSETWIENLISKKTDDINIKIKNLYLFMNQDL